MSSAIAFVSKVLLLLFSLIMFAMGAASLLAGVALLTMKSEAVKVIKTLGGANRKVDIEAATSYGALITAAATAFCCLGGFVLLLSFCGFVGALSRKACLLYFYILLSSLLLLMQLGVVVGLMFFRTKINTEAQNALFRLQNDFYIPLSSYMNGRNFSSEKVAISYLINKIQIWFECCGAKRVGDIAQSKSWKASNRTWGEKKLARPITCCRLYKPKEKESIIKPEFNITRLSDHLLDSDCPFVAAKEKTAHNKTCSSALMSYASRYYIWIIVACGGFACAELSTVVFTCCLIPSAGEEDDNFDDGPYDDE